MVLLWIIGIVVVIIILAFILLYNGLIQARNRIKNAWSQIDVQLKKRFDLIPNLVETVKGYAKHEKTVFEEITKARAAVMKSSGNVHDTTESQNMLTGALKSLFAVAENYPDLKASKNFGMLQEELSGVEGKIAYARQAYNDSVLSYNNGIQTFPGNVIAGMFGFKENEFFEVEEKSREPVKVKF
ncbi:LemA family protein [Candidatus Micrarchaeota archaeon]|nr:LemA family protein [Candidatus Micrarchaeota archaeon]MBU1930641.1 LemA family protein [Candidatus Micrarchaeota archaeon]